jgi:quercetin dioxygenase-like cupin family protein
MTNRTKPATRRGFLCWCCAGAAGLAALPTGATAQSPGFSRTILSKQEYPGNDYVTLQVQVDVDPGYYITPHTHPGVETSTFTTGSGTLSVKGQPDRPLAAGEGFQIPAETPHALRNGPTKSRVMAVYVVEKSKPLSTPATL